MLLLMTSGLDNFLLVVNRLHHSYLSSRPKCMHFAVSAFEAAL